MTQQNLENLLTNNAAWKRLIAPYQQPDHRKSIWQIANTLIPYLLLWPLMVWSYRISYWLALPFILLAAGFTVRAFIIFHDCGHGAFFRSRRANTIVGFVTGIVSFTPYFAWRKSHALHHAASGDLDRRGVGDIWMMTVDEFRQASTWQQLWYRIYRNPFILFVVGPVLMFLVFERIPRGDRPEERRSIWITNIALLGVALLMSWLIGFWTYVALQLSVLAIAATAGVWLFYVQHQYEDVYWERHGEWNYAVVAVEGSSFYKLPRVLQWFTGNIGFHHIHHLSPRIPNYNLERCHNDNPELQVEPLTFWQSFKCMRYRLWDEANGRLISFREFRKMMIQESAMAA